MSSKIKLGICSAVGSVLLTGSYAAVVCILTSRPFVHIAPPLTNALLWPFSWLLRHETVDTQIIAASTSVFAFAFIVHFGAGCFACRGAK